MIEAGFLKPWELSLMGKSLAKKLSSFLERHTMAGASLHVALRKRFMDEETRYAITDGATQVLAVGAGFDTLCLRLAAEFPRVAFVELDHPGTLTRKRAVVEAMGDLRPNLHFVGVDLADSSLDESLTRREFWNREASSVVVAEGLLMYLKESAVSALLEGVRRSTAQGSRLLFTFMRADEKGRIYGGKLSFLTRISLALIGEPWRWGVGEGELDDFLESRGFELDKSPNRCNLRQRYLEPVGLGHLPLGDIERVAVAVRI
jgi:methyltransferase (TIGR00027 family)